MGLRTYIYNSDNIYCLGKLVAYARPNIDLINLQNWYYRYITNEDDLEMGFDLFSSDYCYYNDFWIERKFTFSEILEFIYCYLLDDMVVHKGDDKFHSVIMMTEIKKLLLESDKNNLFTIELIG